jgi:hypothetical protein
MSKGEHPSKMSATIIQHRAPIYPLSLYHEAASPLGIACPLPACPLGIDQSPTKCTHMCTRVHHHLLDWLIAYQSAINAVCSTKLAAGRKDPTVHMYPN